MNPAELGLKGRFTPFPLAVAIFFASSSAFAQCNPPTPPTGSYGPAWWSAYSAWCAKCGGTPNSATQSCTPGPNWGGTPGSSASSNINSAIVQSMSPAFQSLFNSIGQSLANALLGNPAAAAADAARRRQEAEREAEEARRRAEARRRMELDLHRRLMSELKLLDDQGDLQPIALADGSLGSDLLPVDDDGLHPSGTSFFGLGGGPEVNPVVNPLNLRRAAFLAEKAQDAPPQDAAFLLDEALQVADGKPAFVEIPDNAVPVVSEDGLRAFQQANIDYRRARSDSLAASRTYDAAERNRRIAEEVRQRMLKERSEGKLTPDRQRLLPEAESARCRLIQAADNALDALQQARFTEAWNDAKRRLSLLATLGQEPAPVSVLDRENDALSRNLLDRGVHRLLHSWRQQQSQQMGELLGQQYGFVNDPALKARAQGIVDRLRKVSPYPDDPKIVRVLDFPKDPNTSEGMEDNAFAVGDSMFIGRKLMSEMDDDQLMFVVGHEMGHIIYDHAYQKDKKAELEESLNRCDQKADASGLSPDDKTLLHNQVSVVRFADYSRDQELQADRMGAYLALAAGARPEGIRKAFEWDAQNDAQNLAQQEAEFEKKMQAKLPPGQTVPTMPPAERKLQDQMLDHPSAQQRYGPLQDIYGTTLLPPLEPN
jgi:Zn-dependent protease with chaperone function